MSTGRSNDSYRSALYAHARKFGASRDDAEDLVQDTLLKAHIHAGQFKEGSRLAWLYVILRNCWYSSHRRTRMNRDYAHLIEQDDTYNVPYDDHCELQDVATRFQQLTLTHQDMLYDLLSGMEYEEIARAHGLPLGTVKSRIARARKALA